ncbi:hypothetical protein [Formosa sp. PL04]|uniref:DUF7064 domain-containing protein n=1 Tax=Formosa sp. PL04 TaxID=3081755 RepID=UPI0029828B80|nr:hypothetical protein [Formosa sp. PL04]MDW5289649.1 hypothetical protein [Formosa sp. PL04]
MIKKQLLKRDIELTPLEEIEQKHKDPSQNLFNDSSYFNGISDDGSFFFVRQSFRTTRGNEYWLEVFFPDLGLLRLKQHPGEEGEGFLQGNLRFDAVELGKEWNVTFQGDMDLKGTSKKVNIDLKFEAETPIIDFQNAMIVDATANAIAKAKWSRSFFEKLKDSKKQHFEQGGRLTGTIEIDGDKRPVDFYSMRDHSWGIRKWGGWKRHVWICGMMENKQCFNFSMVQYDYMGQLSAGFVTEGEQIHYLREFPTIEDFAKDPIFPDKLDLKLKYSDGKSYHLICERKSFVPYNMDNEYQINEGVSFGTVNGIPIRLVTEFGFNPSHYDI